MSIQTQIGRLADAKAALKTAIEQKGVDVPEDAPLEQYATLVEQIAGGEIAPTLLATLNGDGESIELTADVELTDGLYAFGGGIPENTPDDNKGQTLYVEVGDTGIFGQGIRTPGMISNATFGNQNESSVFFVKTNAMYVCGAFSAAGNKIAKMHFKTDGVPITKQKIALYSQSSKPVPVGAYAMLWRLG